MRKLPVTAQKSQITLSAGKPATTKRKRLALWRERKCFQKRKRELGRHPAENPVYATGILAAFRSMPCAVKAAWSIAVVSQFAFKK
jgi:hypothetical protein